MSGVRRRVVLATAGVAAGAMLLLVIVLYYVLEDSVNGRLEDALAARLDEAAAAVDAAADPQAADLDSIDGEVALVGSDGILLAGSLPARVREALPSVLVGAGGELGEEYVVRTRALDPGVSDGPVLVAAESTAPYEAAEHLMLTAAGVLAVLTVLGVAVVAAWTVGRALEPVARMAATAEEWSEHDLACRFDLGPARDEITALGSTLDHLLARVEGALHAERRLTAEVAHELRTPLTAVLGAADLALMRPDLPIEAREGFEEVRDGAHRMATAISSLVDLSRHGAADGRAALEEVVALLDLTSVAVRLPAGAAEWRLGVPASLAAGALGPLLDNARRHAERTVTLSATHDERWVRLVVTDDGPGLGGPSDPDAVFTQGGLGLPLARRLARTGGGEVTPLPAGAGAGAAFEVRLPRG